MHSITNMSLEIVDAIINKKPRHRKKKDNNDNKLVRMISILYIWHISEKFKWIGKRFNIMTVFKTKCTLGKIWEK